MIPVSKSGKTLETAVATRIFLDALRASCGNDAGQLKRRISMVTERNSRLWNLGEALGLGPDEMFVYPDHVGGRFSVLTAVGLLPAAVLGLDLEALLEGAAAMTERFRQAPVGDNPVLATAVEGRLIRINPFGQPGVEAYKKNMSRILGIK